MKYMKLGTKPDIFYTEEASRAVVSDVPSDLVVKVGNTTFHLHKMDEFQNEQESKQQLYLERKSTEHNTHVLLPRCALLRRLCSSTEDSSPITIDLHDIPGGEEAFELCAKFCYGIIINVSAHNFVSALCAAKFLRMTESVEKGNLVAKLEAFYSSCIVQGWKDSLVVLQSTASIPEWSENLGIIRRCIDSIVEKIVTPTSKVTWSYTYTRPGYAKEQHQSAPKDWWTEDISDLNIDIFRGIITTLKSTNMLPPQLIGEALHVYAYRWLPISKSRNNSEAIQDDAAEKNRRVLEMIVSLIPAEAGSVSVGFLMKLLKIANLLGVSPVTKAELVRRTSQQLEEATVNDLLLPSHLSTTQKTYDIDLIKVVLESFLEQQRRQSLPDGISLRAIRTVGKLIDAYLQVVARDANVPVSKIASLAEALPPAARPMHDDLYKAINIYLKEHPDLIKEEKKQLCRALDCQKLSAETRAHVVKNEQLPLRTVVQVLFYEQEKYSGHAAASEPQHQESSKQASSSHTVENELRLRHKKNMSKEVGMSSIDRSSSRSYHTRRTKSQETLNIEPHKQGIVIDARREVEPRRGTEIEEIHASRSDVKHTRLDRS
ncbi:BTB/POZ domain-containing protein [Drosera capensis]